MDRGFAAHEVTSVMQYLLSPAAICCHMEAMSNMGHILLAALNHTRAQPRLQMVEILVTGKFLRDCCFGCRDDKRGGLGLCPLLNAGIRHPSVEMRNLWHSI